MIITLDYIIKYRHMCAGVSDNRLQNVVITLDKVKLCLERPGQPPPPSQCHHCLLMLFTTCSQACTLKRKDKTTSWALPC